MDRWFRNDLGTFYYIYYLMYIIRNFYNPSIKDYLLKLPKKDIFPIGTGGGKQVSGFYRQFDDSLYFLNQHNLLDLLLELNSK